MKIKKKLNFHRFFNNNNNNVSILNIIVIMNFKEYSCFIFFSNVFRCRFLVWILNNLEHFSFSLNAKPENFFYDENCVSHHYLIWFDSSFWFLIFFFWFQNLYWIRRSMRLAGKKNVPKQMLWFYYNKNDDFFKYFPSSFDEFKNDFHFDEIFSCCWSKIINLIFNK